MAHHGTRCAAPRATTVLQHRAAPPCRTTAPHLDATRRCQHNSRASAPRRGINHITYTAPLLPARLVPGMTRPQCESPVRLAADSAPTAHASATPSRRPPPRPQHLDRYRRQVAAEPPPSAPSAGWCGAGPRPESPCAGAAREPCPRLAERKFDVGERRAAVESDAHSQSRPRRRLCGAEHCRCRRALSLAHATGVHAVRVADRHVADADDTVPRAD